MSQRGPHERLVEGVTGLYGNLPPGLGPAGGVRRALARAFDAWANGEELCDAQLAEGHAAAGGIFTGVVERVVSPRGTRTGWMLAVLGFIPRAPGRHGAGSRAAAPRAPPPKVESEADFRKRLRRMVTEGEAKRAPVSEAEANELRALGLM